MDPTIECLKKEEFRWTRPATRAFKEIKEKLTTATVLHLLDYLKAFGVACDASGVGIGGVLSQESHHIAFFSEKLNEAKQRYDSMIRSCKGSAEFAILAPLSATY